MKKQTSPELPGQTAPEFAQRVRVNQARLRRRHDPNL